MRADSFNNITKSNIYKKYLYTFLFLFRYIVEELQSSNEYLVSVNISVCLEPNKSKCYIQTQIVKDLLITKPQCNWNMDFKTPGKHIGTNYLFITFVLPMIVGTFSGQLLFNTKLPFLLIITSL